MCAFGCRMIWAAGAVAAMSTITFPAISAIVSRNADLDQQGEFLKYLLAYAENCCQYDTKTKLFKHLK